MANTSLGISQQTSVASTFKHDRFKKNRPKDYNELQILKGKVRINEVKQSIAIEELLEDVDKKIEELTHKYEQDYSVNQDFDKQEKQQKNLSHAKKQERAKFAVDKLGK